MNLRALNTAAPVIERSFDASAINAVANDPRVLPWIAKPGQDVLDLTALVADASNVLLMTEFGGFLLLKIDAGTYEVHTIFAPHTPAGYALEACRDGMLWMFTHTDCMEILTKVPDGNVPARGLAIAAGMDLQYKGGTWTYHDGRTAPLMHYAVRYEPWMLTERRLLDAGRWFHGELERQGVHAEHAEDPIHDRFVGAAVLIIRGGQVGKAVLLYNRWARYYGYAPISIVSLDPLVLDVVTCRLLVTPEGGFTCQ